ncbi:SMI1/KNR4 family protein [Paenibacillus sp. F411]|uniref:SMI1/KNR4 family protein n=1 Tax=Paenibacillus sp. F411 TaxID=2820239 RepID=UPI001AAEF33F|nr:SMI1/KNR4 family protein [Paenibacillus sp. F411]MBO2946231.1 SMI1/KNR4 family protein [Paenibacillus sp. F411]
MNKYDEIQKLIAEAGDSVEFADYGEGISEEWIIKAEERLGFRLPDSYKWWLRNYGGGEIYGEEIFSIYEQDFDTVVGGDVVYNYELNMKNKNYSKEKVVICEANDDVFYFDLSKRKDENELAIYSLNDNKKYANDFIEILKKRMAEKYL